MGFKNQVIKIIFLAFFSFLGSVIHGQGNLQFNQVINYTLSANITDINGNQYDTIVFCVPNNKVWKIESAAVNIGSLSLLAPSTINYSTSPSSASATVLLCPINTGFFIFPLWLGSNYCGRFQWQTNGSYPCSNGCRTGLISIIEFNIVP